MAPAPFAAAAAALAIALCSPLASAQDASGSDAPAPAPASCAQRAASKLDLAEKGALAMFPSWDGQQRRSAQEAIAAARMFDRASPEDSERLIAAASVRAAHDRAQADEYSALEASAPTGEARAAARADAGYWNALARIDSAPLAWARCPKAKR